MGWVLGLADRSGWGWGAEDGGFWRVESSCRARVQGWQVRVRGGRSFGLEGAVAPEDLTFGRLLSRLARNSGSLMNMKPMSKLVAVCWVVLLCGRFGVSSAASLAPTALETEKEFFGSGDFNGDGRWDVVIVDRASGKCRVGYQTEGGSFNWAPHRLAGVKDVSGIATGRVLEATRDALVVTSADANQLVVMDLKDPAKPVEPRAVEISALGPNTVAAVDVGGDGNTALQDLYVPSVYGDPNQVFLIRSAAGELTEMSQIEIPVPRAKANRVVLKAGGKELVSLTVPGEGADGWQAEDLSTGEPRVVVKLAGLPAGADYILGEFREGGIRDLLAYKRGESKFRYWPLVEQGGGFQFGAGKEHDLGQPIKLLATVPEGGRVGLVAIFGKGESAVVMRFDGATAPAVVQSMVARQGELLFGVAPTDRGFVMMSAPDYSRFSTAYAIYAHTGETNALGVYGGLASMADSDDTTIPDIHRRAVASVEGMTAGAMQVVTNVIPGTKVKYVMVPIPGGEFTMGSPAGEKGRNADEGPMRKVRVDPFWMGAMEVRWEEYEVFMYPDDEKKLREINPSDAEVSKVSDAVTRPSKPYMEMSFGMGKDGYPAISMTQHAANKYCQWLSAKTGHFYRLPTEAEWEYACRAGTTTAYSFGDDVSLLDGYGWYEDNSDFKYQKVGKKKPNPWGLFDMHGNVAEWCLDQYGPDYSFLGEGVTANPWNKATQPYPHVARGGSWDDAVAKLRSAARRGSDPTWKMRDPQLPKSIWWLTDAQFVGFRLVRPLVVPSAEDLKKYWNSGVERE